MRCAFAVLWAIACTVSPTSPSHKAGTGSARASDSAGSDSAALDACAPLSLDGSHRLDSDDLFGAPVEDPGTGALGPGLALGDFDADGDLDAFAAFSVPHSRFLTNPGDGRLLPTDAWTVDGAPPPPAAGAASADLDGDGDLDIVLGTPAGSSDLVLWNDGAGQFTSEALPDTLGQSMGPSLADVDGDGRLDIFIPGYVSIIDHSAIRNGAATGDGNALWLQSDPGTFQAAHNYISDEQRTPMSFHGAWLDHDNDGDIDLFVSNDFGMEVIPQDLLLNSGGGKLEPHPGCACDDEMYAMGAAVGDVDGDQRPDLHVSNIGANRLYIQQPDGTYVDMAASLGARPIDPASRTTWGSRFIDLDGDGWLDLVMVNGPTEPDQGDHLLQPDVLFLGDGDGRFAEVTYQQGFDDTTDNRAIVSGDLNRDGRPDLLTAGRTAVRVWLAGGGCNNRLTLRLNAGPGNSGGIGTRVDVQIADQQTTQWVWPSSTFSSSESALSVGLGSASSATQVKVTWPNGQHDLFGAMPAGNHQVTSP